MSAFTGVTKEQALQGLADVLAEVHAATKDLSPRQAAERAWHFGGPSVEEIEAEIIAARAGMPVAA